MHDPEYHADSKFPLGQGDEMYAVLDARGVLMGLSPSAEALIGYEAADIRGWRGTDLLHTSTDASMLRQRWRSGTETPETMVYLGSAVLRHRSGRGIAVVLRACPIASTSDDAQWLIQALHPETAQRDELSEALLRGLFTESPFLIDVFDRQFRFIAQNYIRQRAGVFSGKNFAGLTMAEVAPPGLLDTAALEARQRRVLETGEALLHTEVRGRTPDDPDREHVWSESILPLYGRSGEVIALAHTVADVTEQVRARERLALANEASVRIGTSLDVLQTAREFVEVAVPEFADYAYVNLLDPVFGGEEPGPGPTGAGVPLRRAASAGVPGGTGEDLVPPGRVDPFAPSLESLFSQALTNGDPRLLTGAELIEALEPLDPRRAALVRTYGVHSWLLIPMFARGRALGAAVFARFQRAHGFETDDVPLAQDIVARAAVCIDNARRYTRERATALELQRSLLPQQLPALRAVEATSCYVPASGQTHLGSAWFDVIPLSGARVALVVGDAAGHGLQAAVTMGRLRTAVQTLADLDLPPDEMLAHLDGQARTFHDDQGEQSTGRTAGTTCLYAVFDPVSRQCVLARAGHPPPALISRAGKVELLEVPDGPPLGHGGPPFECREVTLTDGDLLVLCSDALVKTTSHSTNTGLERLRDTLSGCQHLLAEPPEGESDLEAVCEAVISRRPTTHSQDDAALLVARVHGLDTDRYATWELSSEPEAVSKARTLAARKLAEWGLDNLAFTTELVVSELVTNAIRYSRPPIRMRLIRDRSLICEVSDGSSTSPHIRHALETDEGGRGLYLVAKLTQVWGTRYHARGKTIWAEQPFSGLPEDDGAPMALEIEDIEAL
ncbi:SpoIIE family protein phosphatase [Streptomyces chartreusis]|uniref:SpoIIE family protein phosphatase n=1 Tax=Streptomyces chartreusis TaxID=1969 RepID=UPI003641342A